MDTTSQERPAAVPVAKQAGENQARWAWIEGSVWTPRMVAALAQGVKGGKWFQRWPNAFFADHGLFSLTAAHAAARHPSAR